MDVAKAVKMRRWILGLVIGRSGFLANEPRPDFVLGIVDLDLDYGPKITSIYPPLDLSDPEAENMLVLSGFSIYVSDVSPQEPSLHCRTLHSPSLDHTSILSGSVILKPRLLILQQRTRL